MSTINKEIDNKNINSQSINNYVKTSQDDDDTYIVVVGQHGDVNVNFNNNVNIKSELNLDGVQILSENSTNNLSTCRLCMSYDNDVDNDLISILGDAKLRFINTDIITALESCTGLIVSEDDELPKNICNFCLSKLEVCWAFKLQCLKSDKLMRELNQASKQFCEMSNTVSKSSKPRKKKENNTKGNNENNFTGNSDSDNGGDNSDELEKIKAEINNQSKSDKNLKKVVVLRQNKRKQILTPISWTKSKKTAHVSNAINGNKKSGNKITSQFCCDICGKKCSNEEEVIEHKNIHSLEYPYNCKLCKRLFRTEGALTVHMRTNHKFKFTTYDNYRLVKCNICNVSVQKNIISDHYLNHKKLTSLIAD